MILYIDFDGIIADTWPIIVEKYINENHTDKIEELKLRELFKNLNWKYVLKKSKKNIKNIETIFELKKNNIEVKVLSKINVEEERKEKEKYINEISPYLEIITVPIDLSKDEVVEAKGNILIDDEIKNIESWIKKGGLGILYSKNNDGKDSDGNINTKYICISTLDFNYIRNLLLTKQN